MTGQMNYFVTEKGLGVMDILKIKDTLKKISDAVEKYKGTCAYLMEVFNICCASGEFQSIS